MISLKHTVKRVGKILTLQKWVKRPYSLMQRAKVTKKNEKSMTDTFVNYFIKDETKNKSEHAATLSGLTIIASVLGLDVASSSSASMSNYVSRNEVLK